MAILALLLSACQHEDPPKKGTPPTPDPADPQVEIDTDPHPIDREDVPWVIEALYLSPPDRPLFDVGLIADSGSASVIWNDGNLDQTDVRTRIARLDPEGAISVEEIGATLEASSTMPAITRQGSTLYAAALTPCDERWRGCGENRQVELLVSDAPGQWLSEPIDSDNDPLDHGRTNLAFSESGELHACYKVLHEGEIEDEVHCSVRSAGGAWGPSLQISGDNPGADDHPTVAIGPDGLRVVGYSRKEGLRRRAALWVERAPGEGDLLTLQIGYGVGEDPLPAFDSSGMLHLLWREEIGDSFVLVYGQCAGDCSRQESFAIDVITPGALLDSPSIALDGETLFFTYTEGDSAKVGWRCPDGRFFFDDPDGSPGEESLHRGQPSIAVDAAAKLLAIAYAKIDPLGQTEVRVARRTLPVCGAGPALGSLR